VYWVFDESTINPYGKKGCFGGFSGPESIRNAEGVRRKVTTGNKGGAKGFQPSTAYCRVLWVSELFIVMGGYLGYLGVRRLRLIALNYSTKCLKIQTSNLACMLPIPWTVSVPIKHV